MGLLDVLNSDEGRMGLALLAAGAPRLDGAGFGQRLNEAVGSFDQYKSGQDAASFKKLQADALRQELLGRQNAATEAARLRGLMQSDMSYQDMVRQGVPVEQVKALAESRNFGRDEVARTTEIEGPGGQKIIQGFDKFNNPIGAGVAGYVAPQLVNQGDRQAFVKPSAGLSLPVGMSPSERDASARGWASNNLAAQRLAFEQAGGAEANKPQFKDGMWLSPPRDMAPGESRVVAPAAGVKDANDALALIAEARNIIPKSTGSFLGAGVDLASRGVGISTAGDMAAAQLKAIEGALVSKMPKMSGPQSDKDVALYKQMAGDVGDNTIPPARKLAALQTIESIQKRYASGEGGKAPSIQAQPLPPDPSAKNLVRGTVYDTPKGPMVWNGLQFRVAQ